MWTTLGMVCQLVLKGCSDLFISLIAVGKLTHEDYKVIPPMLDSALKEVRDPQVKALIDGTQLGG